MNNNNNNFFRHEERRVKRAFGAILIAMMVYTLGTCAFFGVLIWAIIEFVKHFA